MTEKYCYFGSMGPVVYDDGDTYDDGEYHVSFRGSTVYFEEIQLNMAVLPNVDPAIFGRVWRDGYFLKVSSGAPA